jgi:hypothetical protein
VAVSVLRVWELVEQGHPCGPSESPPSPGRAHVLVGALNSENPALLTSHLLVALVRALLLRASVSP